MRSFQESCVFEAHLTKDYYPSGMKMVNLDQALGVEYFGKRMLNVPFYEQKNQYFAKPLEHYIFDRDVLEAVVSFLNEPFGDALYLQGPSGCGKTSILHQVCALLGWPILQVTLNGHFEVNELIGHPNIVNNQLVYIHGPLARAMKYGYILVLNEIDLADPAELAGLNDVLEGRHLVIIQNDGEVVEPHPNFRLAVTANTKGSGEYRTYCGTKMLNSAFLDRFRFVECSFIPHDSEEILLKQVTPYLSQEVQKMMIEVALKVRASHLEALPTQVNMTIPMSTRALLRWGHLIKAYKHCEDPVHLALKHAFTGRLTADEANFVHRLCGDWLPSNLKIFEKK